MDLTQRKLTRAEWNSIELPISDEEKRITTLIKEGYQNQIQDQSLLRK